MTSVIFKNVRLLNFEDSEGMTSSQDVMVSNGKIVTIGKDLPTVNVTKVLNGNNNLLIHVGQADDYVNSGILEETLVHEHGLWFSIFAVAD